MKEETKIELTKEQVSELEKIFQYKEKAEFTEEEKETLKEMFSTPEKLLILRKGLGMFTIEEKGLAFPSAQNLIQADIVDLEKYAIETAVSNLATEKVRMALFSLYRMINASKVSEKRKEFEKKNIEDFEEKKRTEEYENKVKEGQEHLGSNL